tara:strand:- start:7976 stop:8161 length:186 start_codon:yes stop_codon:yes gene_type:complete
MANITIDGKDYDSNDLNDKAKEQLANLQFVQNEMKKIEAQLGVYKTAASVFSSLLKKELNN